MSNRDGDYKPAEFEERGREGGKATVNLLQVLIN